MAKKYSLAWAREAQKRVKFRKLGETATNQTPAQMRKEIREALASSKLADKVSPHVWHMTFGTAA